MHTNEKKEVSQVETGLTHPFLWMSGKPKKDELAGRVYFPLPNLSRNIERTSARRVKAVRTQKINIYNHKHEKGHSSFMGIDNKVPELLVLYC